MPNYFKSKKWSIALLVFTALLSSSVFGTYYIKTTILSPQLPQENKKTNQNNIKRKTSNQEIAELKKELENQRSINDNQQKQFESALSRNRLLKTELDEINHDYEQLPADIHTRVKKAKMLRAYNITINSINYGTDKNFIPVFNAGKTQTLGVKFTLLENLFAEPGIRVITTDIISADVNVPSFPVTEVKKEVDYNNKDTPVNVTINFPNTAPKGNYILRLFENSVICGTKNLSFK